MADDYEFSEFQDDDNNDNREENLEENLEISNELGTDIESNEEFRNKKAWMKFIDTVLPSDNNVFGTIQDLLPKFIETEYKYLSSDKMERIMNEYQKYVDDVDKAPNKFQSSSDFNKFVLRKLGPLLKTIDNIYFEESGSDLFEVSFTKDENKMFEKLASLKENIPNFENIKLDIFVLYNILKNKSSVIEILKEIKIQQFIKFMSQQQYKTTNLTVEFYTNEVNKCESIEELNSIDKIQVPQYFPDQIEALKRIYAKVRKYVKNNNIDAFEIFKEGIISIVREFGRFLHLHGKNETDIWCSNCGERVAEYIYGSKELCKECSEILYTGGEKPTKIKKESDTSDIEIFKIHDDVLKNLSIKKAPINRKIKKIINKIETEEEKKTNKATQEIINLHKYIDWLYSNSIPVYEFGYTTNAAGIQEIDIAKFLDIDPIIFKFIKDNEFPKFEIGQRIKINKEILEVSSVSDNYVTVKGLESGKTMTYESKELWAIISKSLESKRFITEFKPSINIKLERQKIINFSKWAKKHGVDASSHETYKDVYDLCIEQIMIQNGYKEFQLKKLSNTQRIEIIKSKGIFLPDISIFNKDIPVPVPNPKTSSNSLKDDSVEIDENVSTKNIYDFFKNIEAYGYSYVIPVDAIKNTLYKNISTFDNIKKAIEHYISSQRYNKETGTGVGFYFCVKLGPSKLSKGTGGIGSEDAEYETTDNYSLDYYHILPESKDKGTGYKYATFNENGIHMHRAYETGTVNIVIEHIDTERNKNKMTMEEFKKEKIDTRKSSHSYVSIGKGWATTRYFFEKDANGIKKLMSQKVIYTDFIDYLTEHRNVLYCHAMMMPSLASSLAQKIKKITQHLGDSVDEMMSVINELIIVPEKVDDQGTPEIFNDILDILDIYCMTQKQSSEIIKKICKDFNITDKDSLTQEKYNMIRKFCDVLEFNTVVVDSSNINNLANQLLLDKISPMDVINTDLQVKNLGQIQPDIELLKEYIESYNNRLSIMKKFIDNSEIMLQKIHTSYDYNSLSINETNRLKIILEKDNTVTGITKNTLIEQTKQYRMWLYCKNNKSITLNQQLYIMSQYGNNISVSERKNVIKKLKGKFYDLDRDSIDKLNVELIKLNELKLYYQNEIDSRNKDQRNYKVLEFQNELKNINKNIENIENKLKDVSLPKFPIENIILFEFIVYKLSKTLAEYLSYVNIIIKLDLSYIKQNSGKVHSKVIEETYVTFRKSFGKIVKYSEVADIVGSICSLIIFYTYNERILVKNEETNKVFYNEIKNINTDKSIKEAITEILKSFTDSPIDKESVKEKQNYYVHEHEKPIVITSDKISFDLVKKGAYIDIKTNQMFSISSSRIEGKYYKLSLYDIYNVIYYCYNVLKPYSINYVQPRNYYKQIYNYLVNKNTDRNTDRNTDSNLEKIEKIEMDNAFRENFLNVFVFSTDDTEMINQVLNDVIKSKTGATIIKEIKKENLKIYNDKSVFYPIPIFSNESPYFIYSKSQEPYITDLLDDVDVDPNAIGFTKVVNKSMMSTWLSSRLNDIPTNKLPYKFIDHKDLPYTVMTDNGPKTIEYDPAYDITKRLNLSNKYVKLRLRDPEYENRFYDIKIGISDKSINNIPKALIHQTERDPRYVHKKNRIEIAKSEEEIKKLTTNIYTTVNTENLSKQLVGNFDTSVWSWIPENDKNRDKWSKIITDYRNNLIYYTKKNPSLANVFKDYLTKNLEIMRYKIEPRVIRPIKGDIWDFKPVYDIDISFWENTVKDFKKQLEDEPNDQKRKKLEYKLTEMLTSIKKNNLPSIQVGIIEQESVIDFGIEMNKYLEAGLIAIEPDVYTFNKLYNDPFTIQNTKCRHHEIIEGHNESFYTCLHNAKEHSMYCKMHENEAINNDNLNKYFVPLSKNPFEHYMRLNKIEHEEKKRDEDGIVKPSMKTEYIKTNKVTLGDIVTYIGIKKKHDYKEKLFDKLRIVYNTNFKKFKCNTCNKFIGSDKGHESHDIIENKNYIVVEKTKKIMRQNKIILYYPVVVPIVTVTVNDIMDYMMDSYQQHVHFGAGIKMADDNKTLLYINMNRRMGAYVYDRDSVYNHNKKVSIVDKIYKEFEYEEVTSIAARRLAFVYGIDINNIGFVYKTDPDRTNIITELDVAKYVRDNRIKKKMEIDTQTFIKKYRVFKDLVNTYNSGKYTMDTLKKINNSPFFDAYKHLTELITLSYFIETNQQTVKCNEIKKEYPHLNFELFKECEEDGTGIITLQETYDALYKALNKKQIVYNGIAVEI